MQKVYRGSLDARGVCYVEVVDGQGNVRPLADHGFEWGVSGAGLPELAAAILEDALGDYAVEPRRFVLEILAVLPARWTLGQQQVADWAGRSSGNPL